MKYTVKITADHNDGDFITAEHIMDKGTFSRFERIAKLVKEHGKTRYNWDIWSPAFPPHILYKDILTEDEIEWFGDWLPYVDNGVIHTIEHIHFAPQVDWKTLI